MSSDPRRDLPSVDALLATPAVRDLLAVHPRGRVAAAARAALATRRAAYRHAEGIVEDMIVALRPSIRPVINATGVILHTNLGRAPLADEAVAAAVAAAGYGTLEWDAATGGRGSRQTHVRAVLTALTGAESAAVANTNAGAVLLALVALASGREVVVSRGQLVEIGGGFRIPEILAASGCRLVEVGTTNRTRIADYAAAVGPDTAAVLRVHPSNYRVVGFTEEASLRELVTLARERRILVIDDLGSGAVDDDPVFRGEPDVAASVAAGADVVAFSADKLLGGPQAGILVGRRQPVERCAAHPLMRALRPDKLTLAALEATLGLHMDRASRRRIPAVAMLDVHPGVLRARAERLAEATGGEVVATVGRVGGGSLPTDELGSYAVALDDAASDPSALAARLRALDPPVVARVADDRVLLDVLTMSDDDVAVVVRLLS